METKQPTPSRNIVCGQRVQEDKIQAAKRLRRDMTPAEKRLRHKLRGSQLHGFHFRRQQIIRGFIADFYCNKVALAVECDGLYHNGEYDSERDSIFATAGVRVLRFKNEEVLNDLPSVLRKISEALAENPHEQ